MNNSPRDHVRLRRGLNPLLTTSLGSPFNAQHNTPISAISMSSSHLQSAQTPSSTIQPYNPQEWVASPAQVTPERQHQYSADVQVAPPPPPPPYSPPRSQQSRPVSGVFVDAHTPSQPPPPVSRLSTTEVHRPSPEPPGNPSFPPPPGVGGRDNSRERRFRLPSLGRRRDTDLGHNGQEHQHPQMQAARHSMGPGSFHAPEPIRPLSVVSNVAQTAPPAARRAASAGAIETPTSARSRADSESRWDMSRGVPPPPPPGPPPASSRSQSVQGMDRSNAPIISPPTRRPPPSGITTLGAVPPTPAGWVDSPGLAPGAGPPPRPPKDRSPDLTIDTASAQAAEQAGEIPPASSSAGGLNRARAVRHDKTIIQRRAESRHGSRSSIDERTHPQSISDITVPSHSSAEDSGRRTRLTPRSGGRMYMDLPQMGESSKQASSQHSTPRVVGTAKVPHPIDTATPPFSPMNAHLRGSSSIAPKSLPTPPPQVRSASSSQPRESSRPPASASATVSKHLMVTQTAEQFAAGAIERFQAFAAREAMAATDADRVRLFADFIVDESRVRRERYAASIGAMGSEIFDLTRDLFRPMSTARRESVTSPEEWTPGSSEPTHSKRGSFSSAPHGEDASTSAPTSGRLPPSPSGLPQGSGTWASNYMPSLSPILSMSVSDRYGDGDSRGRPSSRWWEADSQGDPERGFARSKRESKYMGVPKDQWAETDPNTALYGNSSEQSSSNEYPPEKTGLHDLPDEMATTPQPLQFSNAPFGSTPSPTPRDRNSLDISRLVTLPPPYPRHHPAVNNNHPELTAIRTCVRGLTDMSELDSIKETFTQESSKRRAEFSKAVRDRRQSMRANLQRDISSGQISYADAATIESDGQQQEQAQTKDLEKSEYEKFQNQVIVPINDILTARIIQATQLYDDLSRRLFDNAQNYADMPQEEGDDRPELLEKLTLLKWIFEARESLHRAIYDLLSDRNNRFREVVITPYKLAGNTEKMKSAEAFFDDDVAKREYAYAIEVLNRARDLRAVVDEAVQRGVALQLSAFWDIAPPLSSLIDAIPPTLEGFKIHIPSSEISENPVYRDHPLQYLYSLLLHAGKSTFQFIEAHTNLLCLLHEVKEAVVHAKVKVLQTQLQEEDGTPVCKEERDDRAKALLHSEEQRLTDDLKEKVREVQDQWNSSLGERFRLVKERVGEWLLQTGGWDETLEEGAIGGV